jgi:hypothetical protein
VSASDHADLLFFWLTRRSRAAASGAQNPFFTDRSHPLNCVSPCSFFFWVTSAEMSARVVKFSFAVRSPPCRNVRARRNLFRLSGRIVTVQQIFFGCPVASTQQSARADFFWPCSFFFCRPVSSAQNLLTFLWRMESLQYTFSESCAVLF